MVSLPHLSRLLHTIFVPYQFSFYFSEESLSSWQDSKVDGRASSALVLVKPVMAQDFSSNFSTKDQYDIERYEK